MKKIQFGIFVLIVSLFVACEEDTFNDGKKAGLPPSDLAYATTINVYEGEAFRSGQPVLNTYGADPLFSIVGGAANGQAMTEELLGEFQIADTTGIIKVESENLLLPQVYALDIHVATANGETTFTGAYEVEILAQPEQ